MRLLLRGGRIIDPSQHIDEKMDLLIENGKIVKVAKNIYKEKTAAEDTASSTLKNFRSSVTILSAAEPKTISCCLTCATRNGLKSTRYGKP